MIGLFNATPGETGCTRDPSSCNDSRHRGAPIFGDDKDREHSLSRVGEIAEATRPRILA